MAVTSEFIYIILFFFQLFNNTRPTITMGGKDTPPINLKTVNVQELTSLHWPKGIVTYYLDNHSYDYYIAHRVRMAMNVLESVSCVSFKPTLIKPDNAISWINFTNPQRERNCIHEPVFKKDGEIVFVIGYECMKEHEILHSLLHAIGFKDEVSHPQRDQFIRVMWNNIQPEYKHLYRIRSSNDETSQLVVEYDPLSIMHFHDRAFSINGQATVTPLLPGLAISPSDDLSQLDKMKLRLLFDHECNKRKVGDMIDTCMKFSNTGNLKGSKEEKKSKPKRKKKERKTESAKTDDEVHNGNEDDNTKKNDKVDKGHSDEEADGAENSDTVDEVKGQNVKKLRLIENQYDLNEYDKENDVRLRKVKESSDSTSVYDEEEDV